MRRIAQVIQLNPQHEAEYVRMHEEVWPGVLATVAACRIRNYSIFLRDHVLFAYFEYHGDDLQEDLRRMAACPETQRWWGVVDPMQAPMTNAEPGERWSQMREVFHFDG